MDARQQQYLFLALCISGLLDDGWFCGDAGRRSLFIFILCGTMAGYLFSWGRVLAWHLLKCLSAGGRPSLATPAIRVV